MTVVRDVGDVEVTTDHLGPLRLVRRRMNLKKVFDDGSEKPVMVRPKDGTIACLNSYVATVGFG